ncbi:gamma-glutamyltranspeptidase / glutathione hydrolase [Robiginitalea myxolifaciens]|uniref:Glutathione hydrolase proenzyme n=1 Tax=Robiginitalea myxolifaciens TaxID=400055 RepID=A0A1I6GZH1_9FLAO|nr:gamma-glutamyltranspeptidase / glutathione hydrolase [Robiginitalea myxolifaciens]
MTQTNPIFHRLYRVLFLALISSYSFLHYACKTNPEAAPTGVVHNNAMVVSARIEASRIGMEVLKKGGNAFDAMIATEIALAAAYPFAGNLGGGGFMVYRMADGQTGTLDYREKAPLAAHRDMYLDSLGNPDPKLSRIGATAVGVPGTIAGIFAVHEKFGSLPMEELLAPTIALCEQGVVVTEKQAARLENYRDQILEVNGDSTVFSNSCKPGDTLRYAALAQTLRRISEGGRDEFYMGETAQVLSQFMKKRGGYITMEDLAQYEAVWRDPVTFQYRDLNVISMGPPSSGGITMQQILKMMEPYDVSDMGHHSAAGIQLFTEAARRAYADRNYYLGDPDFVEIPVSEITDPDYLQERMENYNPLKDTPSETISKGEIAMYESSETTHYSIVDQFGNAISATTTLNGAYGSKLYVQELGFFLNNEMDDFSAKPGEPNMFGLIGAEANSIAPGKRMLSSMTPTIVEKDGELWLVVGTPGGSTIITAVTQTILNVYEYGLSMQQAVEAPRFHHQWLPDMIIFEPEGFPESLKDSLITRGYIINQDRTPIIGKVDAIRVLKDGRLEAGADVRGDDAASGF